MKTYAFYDVETGIFTGQTYVGPERYLELNNPNGLPYKEDVADIYASRVNLSTGEVEPYEPPAPEQTELQGYYWDAQVRRWRPTPTAAAFALLRRKERDALLSASDWVIARAVEYGEPVPAAWRAYRQALRDIPEQAGFPGNVEWPEPPSRKVD